MKETELKICTGCDSLSTDKLTGKALACCPDNNYIPIKQYVESSKAELTNWVIYDLPLQGGWWNGMEHKFIDSAIEMLWYGISVAKIKVMLQGMYTAVASEFN